MDRRQNTYIMDKGFKGRVSNPDIPLGGLRKIKSADLKWPGLLPKKNCASLPLPPQKVKRPQDLGLLGSFAQEEQL